MKKDCGLCQRRGRGCHHHPDEGEPAKTGRPRKKLGPKNERGEVEEFTYQQIVALARLHPTDEELAGMMNVSVRTIRNRKREDETFCRALLQGLAQGRISLRRKLFRKAGVFSDDTAGDGPTLRFLAINILGMHHKITIAEEGIDLESMSDDQLQRIANGEHPIRVMNER